MSSLSDIESGVIGAIGAIQSGGQPAFATVEGTADGGRQTVLSELNRLLRPAALVVFVDRGKKLSGGPSAPRFDVLISASSQRGGDEPRLGGTGVVGGFELAELVSQALHRAVVATDQRVEFQTTETIDADTTTIVYRQRYGIFRLASLTAPTFAGSAIAGSGSDVEVLFGSAAAEEVAFGFPGIRGLFVHHLGLRNQAIEWRGSLRATDHTAMNTIETTLLGYVADPRSFDLVDPFGRTHSDVVLDQFERTDQRGIDPISGEITQPFVLAFRQLLPA